MSRQYLQRLLMELMDMTFFCMQLYPRSCSPATPPTPTFQTPLAKCEPESIGQDNYSWPAVSISVSLQSICSPFIASVCYCQEKM